MQAAVLAAGPGATLSHRSAAELLCLTEMRAALIDVIPPNQRGRKIDGIRWHRVPPPEPDEVTSCQGIRCTTVSRTIVDLAGSAGVRTLRGLVEEAAVRRSLDAGEIERILGRRRRRGAPALRGLLAPWQRGDGDLPTLRSRFEARMWPDLIEHGLPIPLSNAAVEVEGARLELDFLWAERKLVVETDGEASHATISAFHRDRRRDQLLVSAGYRVIRVTWGQVRDELDAVLARIRQALEAAG
jgi:very-short-patch-repair endonuclease